MSAGSDVEVVSLRGRLERCEAILRDIPNVSKYHGHGGFEMERFLKDCEEWNEKRRAYLASPGVKREG